MKDIYILAIESSCDETSMSIIKNGSTEICTVTNTQIDIHKKFGGVVPEVASRSHIENITMVFEEVFKKEGHEAFSSSYDELVDKKQGAAKKKILQKLDNTDK